MQGSVENNQDNVVSLHSRGGSEKEAEAKIENADSELSFAEVIRRNAENIERMKRERAKANQSVIRSYRLKR